MAMQNHLFTHGFANETCICGGFPMFEYPSGYHFCNPWLLAAQAALIDQISMKDLLQFFDERIAAGREWVVW